MTSTGVIKRVEIFGQFDPANPWICNSARIPGRIQREAISNVTNWNQFCDEADQVLTQLKNPKRHYFILSSISLFVFIILVASSFFLNFAMRSMYSEMKDSLMYLYIGYGVFVIIISIFLITSSCKLQNGLKQIFGEIDSLCQRYSIPNVVTYTLTNEWWGGCSKAYSRRWFLNVNVYNGSDVEQQQHHQQQQVVIAAETIVDNPSTGALSNDGNNSSSLFNQLASGMK